jgi:imidazolonepropionase-like amidohydrolase
MSVRGARTLLLPLLIVAVAGCSRAATSPAADFVAVDAPVIALTNARVIDGTGSPGRADQTVIIRGGTIEAVGDAGTVTAPPGARVIDLSGRTLVPGFVMLHEHLFGTPDGSGYVNTPETSARLYLAGGATTIRTGGSGSWREDAPLRQAIERGDTPGPDVDLTSPYLNLPRLPILEFSSGADRGVKLVSKWADRGATSFKAYEHLTRDELAGVIQEAHRRGLKVTGHLCAVTYSEAADLGIDSLEHGVWVASDFVKDKQPDECPGQTRVLEGLLQAGWSSIQPLIAKLVARRVAITSTLTVFETFVAKREPAGELAKALMAPSALERYERRRAAIDADPQPVWADLLRMEMKFEREFVKAGGLLAAGTDPTGSGGLVPGFSNQRAIELLVEAGFSVPEAIRIATLNGAKVLGREERIGTIAVGKQADLVVLRGNPEDRVSAIEQVETVFRKGVGYDPVKLIESTRGMVFEK